MLLVKTLAPLCALSLTTVHGYSIFDDGPVIEAEDSAFILHDTLAAQVPISVGTYHHNHANGTIYETLSNNPRFSLVTKALNFVDDIGRLLNDTDTNLTFFAPPDEVLRGPKRGPHKFDWAILDSVIEGSAVNPLPMSGFSNLADALFALDSVDEKPHFPTDPKKRKKILKVIIRAILKYHILPTNYDILQLGHNTTYATNLAIPILFDGQPLRLRVGQIIPPVTTINILSKVIHADIPATNGFIHAINYPLIPPITAFQDLYLLPQIFSFFTSALQRSGLTKALDIQWSPEKGLFGAKVATVFVPTNRAFERLPKRLQFFLFSPLGAPVLRKLLQYHIIPDIAIFSNYIYHRKGHKAPVENDYLEPSHPSHDDQGRRSFKSWFFNCLGLERNKPVDIVPIFKKNLTLETALFNHTINAVIIQNKITFPFPGHHRPSFVDTKILVNHHTVGLRDIVANNGAIHVTDRLLDPRKHRPHHGHKHRDHKHRKPGHDSEDEADDSWDNWEEWLLRWANED